MSAAPALRILGERLCWREEGVAGDRSCPRLPAVIHCRNCSEYARIGRVLLEREAPAELARETAEFLAAAEHAAAGESVSLLLFRLGAELFGVKSTLLQEVTTPRPVHRLPSRPGPVFLGLVNVGGELLPCVSAAAALAIADSTAKPSAKARMLVVGKGADRFVFPVDEAVAIRRVPVAELLPPPATVANSPSAKSSSMFRLDGVEVAILDETRFLDALRRSLNP